MSKPFSPRGASYYPPHHEPTDWARDVAAMAAAGMTCIRSAELIASWDYIEQVRGKPDWGWLDGLFEAAHAAGMHILLGTGSPSPPIWLLDRYPDVQIIDRDGQPYPTGTVWRWACRNHPGYLAEVARYLRLLIERYAGHPALWAWQIDNEPGFPFVGRRGENSDRLYDYNLHTAAAFRQWLERKYGTLNALNGTWRWTCTHHQYSDWAQVQPPRSMPQEWGVAAAWLDWHTFLQENQATFIRWQHDLIKTHDTSHKTMTMTMTMTNIFAFSGREVNMGLDPFLMAAQVDAIGYDLYPGIGRRFLREPEYLSMFLDLGCSTALHAGRGFWVPELESGPIAGFALGPHHTTSAADITRYNLEVLGHGAKAILYQGYREWPALPIHWGALADFHGKPTARYEAARRINEMIGSHEALFLAAQPPRAQAAIYYDPRNAAALHGMGAEDLLQRSVRGAYTTLWRAGHPLEFVDSAALLASTPLPYKLILLPAALLVDAATGAALRQFVAAGGTLIACAKYAWLDGRSWNWPDQPGAALDALCGVSAGEIVHDDAVSLRMLGDWQTWGPASSIPGYWHRQPLEPHPGSTVLAEFADGSAAVVYSTLCAGQTFYVGTHLDAAALDHPEAAQLLLALAQQAGLAAPLLVEAAPARVDGHVLLANDRRLVLLTNNGPQPASVRFQLPGFEPTQALELLQDTPVALEQGWAALELDSWGGAAVLLA